MKIQNGKAGVRLAGGLTGLVVAGVLFSAAAPSEVWAVRGEGQAETGRRNNSEEKISMSDVPAAVRRTIDREARGGNITEIVKKTIDGNTIYEFEVQMHGAELDYSIAPDGRYLGVEGAGSGSRRVVREAPYRPHINPADFQTTVDNPYFPLVPGTVWKYIERTSTETLENEVTVTHNTKVIMGVRCVVVHDKVTQDGRLKEDTFDWYAQDKNGTVWYFGEATREYGPGRRVSTEGSWEGGVHGAQPGVIMMGHPRIDDSYRQEYLRGHAEDRGRVVALDESVIVPAGSYTGCVKTDEWSDLETGVENKWYARGVGVVKEVSETGDEVTLVSITRE